MTTPEFKQFRKETEGNIPNIRITLRLNDLRKLVDHLRSIGADNHNHELNSVFETLDWTFEKRSK